MQHATLVTLATAIVGAGFAIAQGTFTVNTPTNAVVQCQPLRFTWVGGTAPYFPVITVGGQPTSILTQYPSTSATSIVYYPNQAVGTTLGITVTDSTGAVAQSGQTPAITAGSVTTCDPINGTGGSSGSTTSAAGASTTVATTTTAPRSSETVSTAPRSSAATTSASRAASASASASARPNSAPEMRAASAVVAGVVGVVAAALLI